MIREKYKKIYMKLDISFVYVETERMILPDDEEKNVIRMKKKENARGAMLSLQSMQTIREKLRKESCS